MHTLLFFAVMILTGKLHSITMLSCSDLLNSFEWIIIIFGLLNIYLYFCALFLGHFYDLKFWTERFGIVEPWLLKLADCCKTNLAASDYVSVEDFNRNFGFCTNFFYIFYYHNSN